MKGGKSSRPDRRTSQRRRKRVEGVFILHPIRADHAQVVAQGQRQIRLKFPGVQKRTSDQCNLQKRDSFMGCGKVGLFCAGSSCLASREREKQRCRASNASTNAWFAPQAVQPFQANAAQRSGARGIRPDKKSNAAPTPMQSGACRSRKFSAIHFSCLGADIPTNKISGVLTLSCWMICRFSSSDMRSHIGGL